MPGDATAAASTSSASSSRPARRRSEASASRAASWPGSRASTSPQVRLGARARHLLVEGRIVRHDERAREAHRGRAREGLDRLGEERLRRLAVERGGVLGGEERRHRRARLRREGRRERPGAEHGRARRRARRRRRGRARRRRRVGRVGGGAVLPREREVEPRTILAARHLHEDAVLPCRERDRHVHDRGQVGGEVAPLVDERPVHLYARRHRRPDRDEVAAAAREGHVRGEVEDLAGGRLAFEGDRPVRSGERPGGARRAAERRGDRVGEDAGVLRPRGHEVERAPAPERAGEGPDGDGAVLGAQGGDPLVLAERLGGGEPGDPRAVRGEPGEATRRERRGEAGFDRAGDGGRLVGDLGEPAKRDRRERVVGRAGRERDELRDLRRHVDAAAGEERRREPRPGVPRRRRDEGGSLRAGLARRPSRDERAHDAAAAPTGPRSARCGAGEERRQREANRAAHRASPAAAAAGTAAGAAAGARRMRRPKARSSRATRSRKAA